MSARMGWIAVAAATASIAVLVAAGGAGALPPGNIGISTTLLSRSTNGSPGNGPSSHPAISLDRRYARLLAFDSSATNLVSQPVGGGSNVYFIERAQPFDNSGGPWSGGAIQLASQAPGGGPANGPSTLPAVGGDNKYSPACIAFISAASNLVPGDTNGRPDAFAYFPGQHRTIRVSVNRKGRQANGGASEVAVNGKCTQFAFTDDATNLAGRPPAGASEVYLRDLKAKRKVTVTIGVHRHGHTHRRKKRKTVIGPVTTLVSARGRNAANSGASAPAIAQATGDLVFASRATNLAGGTGGRSQVYGVGPRLGKLHVLSAAGGVPGDGDSDQPAISQNAKGYAFRTQAASLGASGPPQVYRVRVGGPAGIAGPAANAEMSHPAVREQGIQVLFESAASNLSGAQDGAKPPPGVVGCWRYSELVGGDILDSRDSNQHPLTSDCSDVTANEPGNYVFFTNASQVYLRYFGGE